MSSQDFPRVLARVEFITWVPSEAGRINTTDKQAGGVSVWVNHPLDDRYKTEDRGGEEAIRVAKVKLAANGVEWLGLLGVSVNTEMHESMIINQPKRPVNDLGIESSELPPLTGKPRIFGAN